MHDVSQTLKMITSWNIFDNINCCFDLRIIYTIYHLSQIGFLIISARTEKKPVIF
jgi:hypothetical protein